MSKFFLCMACSRETHLTRNDLNDDLDLCATCKDNVLSHFKSTFNLATPDDKTRFLRLFFGNMPGTSPFEPTTEELALLDICAGAKDKP